MNSLIALTGQKNEELGRSSTWATVSFPILSLGSKDRSSANPIIQMISPGTLTTKYLIFFPLIHSVLHSKCPQRSVEPSEKAWEWVAKMSEDLDYGCGQS